MTAPQESEPIDDPAPRLLQLIRALATELHPRLARRQVTLDSRLDQDLGLDSLARVELVLRLEEEFGTAISEDAVMVAETPADLAQLVTSENTRTTPAEPDLHIPAPGGESSAPLQARTLPEVIEFHAQRQPDRVHVTYYQDDQHIETLTYGALLTAAQEVAAGLADRGVGPQSTVAIMLPTSLDYFACFYGTLLLGAIPVPLYPPVRPSQLEDHLRRQARILGNAGTQVLITIPEATRLAKILRAQVPALEAIVTVEDVRRPGEKPRHRYEPKDTDVAFLQYTSGSTGEPKGVVLTHRNLLSNVRAIVEWLELDGTDRCVSWLPLYHDMGLIGAGMGSLYRGFELVLMSPLQFLSRPVRWLQRIDEHQGTVSAGPNFAYELCLSKIADEDLEGLDLSSWRMAVNGAEAVLPGTLRRFAERFAPCGFRPEALLPVYGLAECSVGLTFPPLGRSPRIDEVHRKVLARDNVARPAEEGDGEGEGSVGIPSCGLPLPGHEIRIADAAGRERPDRSVGKVQFRGPSATSGYYRNPQATRDLFDGDWLRSGDLGYLADGELFLTGREKDLIIRSGRNLSPYEIEEAVSLVDGVRAGCVAAFGIAAEEGGTELLVVVAETREQDEEQRNGIHADILAAVAKVADAAPDQVLLATPGTVLKTSSGKIRRSAVRELYQRGALEGPRHTVARQMFSLFLAAAGARARSLVRNTGALLHTAWMGLLFVFLGLPLWCLACVPPKLRHRQILVSTSARAMLLLGGVPFRIRGQENLPAQGACVVAINHTSYSDVLFLLAALPPGGHFVAKREWAHWLPLRLLFGRIGCLFVERFDVKRSVEDAQQLLDVLRAGHRLYVFPEGTFTRQPGLRSFRMGSFRHAAEAGVPVVPAALRGTRSLLREGQWVLHRRLITLTLFPALTPTGDDWGAAVQLCHATREVILQHCGEPDVEGSEKEIPVPGGPAVTAGAGPASGQTDDRRPGADREAS